MRGAGCADARRAKPARAIALGVGVVCALAAATAVAAPCDPAAGRLELLELPAPALDRAKRILVYLPPGYDCDDARRFPVFYFNDGHDLFDGNPIAPGLEPRVAAEIVAREGWYGSWRLDAQLDRAIAAGTVPPLIVVGIASDDGMRSRDLAPAPWRGSPEARGVEYGAFVADTVVSAVDARFRSIADRECRGMGGASLGGVSALQIGLAHADRFALVLSFSPVLADPAVAGYLAEAWRVAGHRASLRLVVDLDDDALGSADRQWLASLIQGASGGDDYMTLVQTPGGRHAIASWSERVVPALARLLVGRCGG
jgi:enterochelin esterase-like enzyme